MSIELRKVTKRVRLGSIKLTYKDLNIRIDEGARVAFLGHKEAGMDAIVSLICGADAPDRGEVVRTHSVSWAIPNSKFMWTHLSLAANARFIARLHETDERAYLAQVTELGALDKFIDLRADECPSEVRSRFAFFVGVCLPFDHYILTSTNIGGKTDRPRIAEIIDDLRQRAGLLLMTQDIKAAEQFCDQAYVFDEGHATYYDDMEAAAEHFGSIASKGEENADSEDSEPELQRLVNEDF